MNEIKCFAIDNSFQVTPQGDIQPCCKFRKPFSKLSTYNSVDDIFNDDQLAELRDKHAKGDWTSNCVRCEQDELLGSQSRRQLYDNLGLVQGTDFFLDISLGNHCNLKCRMCGPENSTQWKTDHKALVAAGLSTEKNTEVHVVDPEQIDRICAFLSTKTGRVVIEVKGGEVLITPSSKYFFEQLVQCPNAANFEIWLTTNGTRIPNWYESIMSQFRIVRCVVSIDGTGATYKYIRGTLHDFEDVFANTLELQQISNHIINFNVVVQNLNIENLPNLAAQLYAISQNITLIVLRSPEHYQVNVFPEHRKEEVINKLQNSMLKYHTALPSIIALMKQPCPSDAWDKFIKVSHALDELRGQQLNDIAKTIL